jgi:predicted RNase H-like HicB family nuclease
MDLSKKIKEVVWLETIDDIKNNLKKLLEEAEKIAPTKEARIYGAAIYDGGNVVDAIDDTKFIIKTDKEWIIFDTENPYNVHVGDTLEEAYLNFISDSIRSLVRHINEDLEEENKYGKAFVMRDLMEDYDSLVNTLEIYRKAKSGKLKFDFG